MEFKNIYHQYNQQIYRLCLGYTNDDAWAKDILQDTFIAVWKNLPKFRGDANVGTWIFRIAVNNCLKQLKKQSKEKTSEINMEIKAPEVEVNPRIVKLRKLIAALPEVDRLIISMELEEVPQAEIAEVLGMSNGNVRVRIHRIKETLTKKFKT